MKIIDEKGKLFGKLNLIDLLVVLILIAAILFLALRFTKQGGGPGPVEDTTKLTYTVFVGSVTPQIYDEVQRQLDNAGGRDQLMASGDMVDAYVVGLTATSHVNYQTDSNGIVVPSLEDGENARYDLVFTVEANVVNPTVNEVGTQEVRVGKTHILKTTHFEFTYGTILTCDWE